MRTRLRFAKQKSLAPGVQVARRSCGHNFVMVLWRRDPPDHIKTLSIAASTIIVVFAKIHGLPVRPRPEGDVVSDPLLLAASWRCGRTRRDVDTRRLLTKPRSQARVFPGCDDPESLAMVTPAVAVRQDDRRSRRLRLSWERAAPPFS